METLPVTIYDCTGIPEKESQKVFLYPNPVQNELTLKCDVGQGHSAQLSIINYFGQEVIRKQIRSDNGRIDITLSTEDLAAGTYTVMLISSEGKMYQGKFLKVK